MKPDRVRELMGWLLGCVLMTGAGLAAADPTNAPTKVEQTNAAFAAHLTRLKVPTGFTVSWFNEGLASLYEKSEDQRGRIRGKINWRFKALEQAIQEGRTVPFRQLMATSETEFYGGSDNASYNRHYGQARYLCYYLQEKGLLAKFYREFVANVQSDPTGYSTLQRVLGTTDMNAFQKTWEKFVLELRRSDDW